MDCTAYKDTFLARQPIFDTQMSAWGHLLLHRHGPDDSWASFESGYSATGDVLACLPFLSGCIPPQHQTLLHFPLRTIREGFSNALNPKLTTIIIQADADYLPEDITLIDQLKGQGFGLALDTAEKSRPPARLLERAEILNCDMDTFTYDHLTEVVALGKEHGLKLLAKKVSNQQMLDKAIDHGFDLFHGFFFTQPPTDMARTARAASISRLRLFDLLMPDDPDFDALTKAIEPDVAITHRLLAFLNSAHFSFAQEVSSVRQAVVLAGWDPIRNWLRIILLNDLLPGKRSRELGYLSAHRARFLELLAMRAGREKIADTLFLTGLFSMLDTILETPMDKVLRHLPLSREITSSLLEDDGPYAPWLTLAQTIESGKWDELGRIAMGLDLPPGSVAESYRMAFQWADEFFGMPETTHKSPGS